MQLYYKQSCPGRWKALEKYFSIPFSKHLEFGAVDHRIGAEHMTFCFTDEV
jgi:hypothetical protein